VVFKKGSVCARSIWCTRIVQKTGVLIPHNILLSEARDVRHKVGTPTDSVTQCAFSYTAFYGFVNQAYRVGNVEFLLVFSEPLHKYWVLYNTFQYLERNAIIFNYFFSFHTEAAVNVKTRKSFATAEWKNTVVVI